MPSTDAYGAVRAFLPAHVVSVVNAESADLLVAGAVRWTRASQTFRQPRMDKAHPIAVALVPQDPVVPTDPGTAVAERTVVVHAEVYHMVKDLKEGAEQLEVPELIQRALVNALDGAAGLAITGINFRYARAEAISIDEAEDTTSTAKSVTRLEFVYTEELSP